MSEDLLWPEYAGPDDLAAVEAVTVLPDAASRSAARSPGCWLTSVGKTHDDHERP